MTTIKQADLIALATEKRDLMPHSAERWSYLDGASSRNRATAIIRVSP